MDPIKALHRFVDGNNKEVELEPFGDDLLVTMTTVSYWPNNDPNDDGESYVLFTHYVSPR